MNQSLKKGILYGIVGGFMAFIVFVLLQNILRATDVQGFILISTIIICSTMCFCIGCFLENKE